MNLVKMQILAGWNHYYANLGAVCANDYVDEVERCMEQDRKSCGNVSSDGSGKMVWNGNVTAYWIYTLE